ncbi:MAG: acetyl-CoA carboxylase biotin carboxyl carrier protein [Alphaproteobacteria bacterium]|nr:acetyl-CoA carboxylase biotin carboxyl carrier protein [Alphaproteobacteria bacterium]
MTNTKDIALIVRELAALLDETGLNEIEYGREDWHIRIAKGGIAATTMTHLTPTAAASASVALPESGAAGDTEGIPAGALTSPMVGTVYLRPDPDEAAFIDVGDEVREGQTLLLIEAMKTFNEIRAPRSGRISKILVEDGSPVEFGDPLLILS